VSIQTALEFHPGEAATVEVEHAIPALRVSVRAELGVAAGVVVEAVHPALRIPHNQVFSFRGLTGLMTGCPAFTRFAAVVTHTQPALLHTLLFPEHPVFTFGNRVADRNTVFQGAHSKLVRVDAVVNETTGGRPVPRHVGEQSLTGISNHSILLHTSGPARISCRGGSCNQRSEERSTHHLLVNQVQYCFK